MKEREERMKGMLDKLEGQKRVWEERTKAREEEKLKKKRDKLLR